MYKENLTLKQLINQVNEDNKKLKSYAVQQRRYIKMLENVDQEQLNKGNILGLKSSGEGSIVPILKTKIRLLNDELEQLKDEQTNQNRSVKLTKTKELEQQLKRYQDEVIRLSYLLKNTLKISDQESLFSLDHDPDVQQKIIKQIEINDAQREEIKCLKEVNFKLNNDVNKLSRDNQKLQTQMQQFALEKAQLKKQLDEYISQNNQQFLMKKREVLENKLESYIKECDVLKGELTVKEAKVSEQAKQIRDLMKEHRKIDFEKEKKIRKLEEANEKKERENEELKERVYILDLLKQKSQQPKPSETVSPKLIPPTTYRDESTQIPEISENQIQALENTNTVPINQNNLQWTILKLKYKFIKLRIHRENLKERLSTTRYIKIKDLSALLNQSPFNLDENEALELSRYLIEDDRGQSSYVEMEQVQDINLITNSLLERIGKYDVHTFYQEKILLKRIGYIWKSNIEEINKQFPRIQSRRQFEDFLYKLQLKQEEMDFVYYMNYLLNGLLQIVDIDLLQSYFLGQLLDIQTRDTSCSVYELDQFEYYKPVTQKPQIIVQTSPEQSQNLESDYYTILNNNKVMNHSSLVESNKHNHANIQSIKTEQSRFSLNVGVQNKRQSIKEADKYDSNSIQSLNQQPQSPQKFNDHTYESIQEDGNQDNGQMQNEDNQLRVLQIPTIIDASDLQNQREQEDEKIEEIYEEDEQQQNEEDQNNQELNKDDEQENLAQNDSETTEKKFIIIQSQSEQEKKQDDNEIKKDEQDNKEDNQQKEKEEEEKEEEKEEEQKEKEKVEQKEEEQKQNDQQKQDQQLKEVDKQPVEKDDEQIQQEQGQKQQINQEEKNQDQSQQEQKDQIHQEQQEQQENKQVNNQQQTNENELFEQQKIEQKQEQEQFEKVEDIKKEEDDEFEIFKKNDQKEENIKEQKQGDDLDIQDF